MNIIKIIVLIIMALPILRLFWFFGTITKLEIEKLERELSRDA